MINRIKEAASGLGDRIPPRDRVPPRVIAGLGALGLLAVALVIMLAAGLGPFAEEEPTDVERVVERFVEAGNERDFETTCSLLSRRALRAIDQFAQALALRGEDACARVLQARSSGDPEGEASIEIIDSRVSGGRAAVDVDLKRPETPSETQTIKLALEDGEWKIVTSGQ